MEKDEIETVITWSKADKEAEVYSCMPNIWGKMKKLGYKPISEDKNNGKIVAKSYQIPVKIIKFRNPRKLTEEQKAKYREKGLFLSKTTKNRLGETI